MIRIFTYLAFTSVIILTACNAGDTPVDALDKDTIKTEIRSMLSVQDKAWNAGDIEGFMEHYLKSEDLRFASGGNVSRGWQATIDGYKTRYPDRAAMGKLSSINMEINVLSHEYAQVFARWGLVRKDDKPGGLYTLLLKKIDGNWVIISDHTSSD